ncbi:MAG: UbiA prenyltransferase family protein, partial [Anaerolineae bacterium]|nr:UbiA prenyltransferase family protein [Anaerolineae bacterium]
KNGFIFAALVFDAKLLKWPFFWRTVAGFALFSLISGVVYTINDLVDIEKDREHPRKRNRPLPSGRLERRFAVAGAVGIGAGSLVLGWLLDPLFAVILLGYLLLQIAYSFVLKNVVLLDVLTIAAGFVLRVAAGVPLADAERFSPWLYICTTLLALFLALGKRRGELILLGDEAHNHRESLKAYTCGLLDQLISLVTSSTILAYALYTFSAPNLPDSHLMMLTIPFVIYGMFRYLYLVHAEGTTLAPDEVLLTDRPMQLTIVLWGLSAMGILYFG